MISGVEIKGGAGEVEAAVIAVVLDRIAQEEAAALRGRGEQKPGLPAWVTAIRDWEDRPGSRFFGPSGVPPPIS